MMNLEYAIWCNLVDASEAFEDAERAGKVLSCEAIATLYANYRAAIDAAR